MKKLILTIAVSTLSTLPFVACDQYEVIDKRDANTKLVDLKTCKCEIVSKDELGTLRAEAEVGKHINRYQMRTEGYRTWRFDTSTGKLCLLLAPEWDWKKPDTDIQNCAYQKD
jgi:hypothetical protein